jgi:hypothetical protein
MNIIPARVAYRAHVGGALGVFFPRRDLGVIFGKPFMSIVPSSGY